MKKSILAVVMGVMMVGSAQALEVGGVGGYYNATDRYFAGVTLSQRFGAFEGLVGIDRATEGDNQTRYTVGGGVDMFDAGPVTFGLTGGLHYLDNSDSDSDWAYSFGASARAPIANQFSLTGGLSYQRALEPEVKDHEGVVANIGIRYSF